MRRLPSFVLALGLFACGAPSASAPPRTPAPLDNPAPPPPAPDTPATPTPENPAPPAVHPTATPPRGVHLVTDKPKYKAGETVHVYLENTSSVPFVVHHPGGASICAGAPPTLGPIGGSVATTYDATQPQPCLHAVQEPSNRSMAPGEKNEVATFDLRRVFVRGAVAVVAPGRYVVTVPLPQGNAVGSFSVPVVVE